MKARRTTLYAILVLLAGFLGYAFLYDPPYTGLITSVGQRSLVFGHRGFGNYAPDNSLVAAQLAMQRGLDGVDMDGQYSKDKELVVFHDLSVDRLTTGSGKVGGKTVDELRALDLGARFGKGFTGAYVATFEDFVKNITPQGILMVELKVPGSEATGIEERAVEIIRKHQAHEKVFLSSFNPLVLYRLKKIDPRVRTVFIFMDTNWNAELLAEIKKEDLVNLPWFLRQEPIRRAIRKLIKPDLLSVNNEVDEKTIDGFLASGQPIFLWTIDDEARLKWAFGKKPYGVISNEPITAKSLRDGAAR